MHERLSNAAFSPDTIGIMSAAMDSAVATLPHPVNSSCVQSIAETILRTANDGERDPKGTRANGASGASDLDERLITRGSAVALMMIKETKFFRKQAEKAERMARAIADEEASQNLANLAQAYRHQADLLKKTRKKSRKEAGLKAKK